MYLDWQDLQHHRRQLTLVDLHQRVQWVDECRPHRHQQLLLHLENQSRHSPRVSIYRVR